MARTPDFDRVAGVYSPLSRLVFGNRLRAIESAFFPRIPERSKIASLGGGDGAIFHALAESGCAPERLVYVDASRKMIDRARARLASITDTGFAAATEFVNLPADEWLRSLTSQGHSFDAIITPFFLDCFNAEELVPLIEEITSSITPGGLWLLTDFTLPRTYLQKVMLSAMFVFFRLTCRIPSRQLENYAAIIESKGFVAIDNKTVSTIAGPVVATLLQKNAASAS